MKLLRVLVVEDDTLIAMLLAETIIGLGHKICAIETTELGAIAAAHRFQPDMMIVDDGLSAGNGISAVKAILRAGLVPYLFVTGDPWRVQALMPGAIILQKPFFERELVQAIGNALAATAAS
jgi:DNA-binding response OmpR family regulator